MSVYDALKYGWGLIYAIQIEGIPTMFAERETGQSWPASSSSPLYLMEDEDASLVIDDSAEVGSEIDRHTGLGVGMSLTFTLLDTAKVRAYLQQPAQTATLDGDHTAVVTTITVDSTTGWDSDGDLWLGLERGTYTATPGGGTTFTGCRRGVNGKPYAHSETSAGNMATDRPRWWRGRAVTVWAVAIDPAGRIPTSSANVAAAHPNEWGKNARQVWKGHIVAQPWRTLGGWNFEAASIERKLATNLVAKQSGALDTTEQHIQPATGWTYSINVIAKNASGVEIYDHAIAFQPFASVSASVFVSTSACRDLIRDAYSAAVTAASATGDLGALVWQKLASGPLQYFYHPQIVVIGGTTTAANSAVATVDVTMSLSTGAAGGWPMVTHTFSTTQGNDDAFIATGASLMEDPTWPAPSTYQSSDVAVSGIGVKLDDGNPGAVPSTGLLRLSAGDAQIVIRYNESGTAGALVYFGDLTPYGSGVGMSAHGGPVMLSPPLPKPGGDLKAVTVEVVYHDEGIASATMLRCIQSSGTGQRSGTYDTLKQGQGYSIDEEDVTLATFTTLSKMGPLGSLDLAVGHAGQSFAGLWGGLLALAKLAVVSRPDKIQTAVGYDPIRLHVVSTSLTGSDYAVTITDADLLSGQDEPVSVPRPALAPNVVTAKLTPWGKIEPGAVGKFTPMAEDTIIVTDVPSSEAMGSIPLDVSIPITNRKAALDPVIDWATAHMSIDQTMQAIELRIVPWLEVWPGDTVKLSLTHPMLWQWRTFGGATAGSAGYVGFGRVLGRRMNLRTYQTTITVMIGGGELSGSMSPSAEVRSFTGGASAADTVLITDPDASYYRHFSTAYSEAGEAVTLLHYKPGFAEGVGEFFAYNAVSWASDVCTLTGAGDQNGTLVASTSRLTLPTTDGGDLTVYQGYFTHADDGSRWI